MTERPKVEQLERWIIIQAAIVDTLMDLGDVPSATNRAIAKLRALVKEYQNA